MKHGKYPIETLARGVCVVQGQLLVCQSRGDANTYLPGGHVEFRELARVALEREIAEEMGRPATAGRFLGCVEHVFRQTGQWHAEINVLFELRIPGLRSDVPPPSCEDWIAFKWVPLTKLRWAKLEPEVLITELPRWLKGEAGFAGTAVGWKD